jgi:hypothetical protein
MLYCKHCIFSSLSCIFPDSPRPVFSAARLEQKGIGENSDFFFLICCCCMIFPGAFGSVMFLKIDFSSEN